MAQGGRSKSQKTDGKYSLIGSIKGGSYQDALEGCGDALVAALLALLDNGDAMVFGRTRDGSAVFLRILSDDGGAEFYEGSSSGMLSTLYSIREAATSS